MAQSRFVAGVDSSTQSCKVLVVDADTGAIVRQGRASHPDGTEVHPDAWWAAFHEAVRDAGGLADVEAISVGGQQHGMVALDADGRVIRPALLWNDTRSGQAASDLTAELGAQAWADAVGSVPLASYTITKVRWLADAEPVNAAEVAAIALPHDWLSWKLTGAGLDALVTDRSDASGTGYFDPVANTYRRDLLGRALRRDAGPITLPRVLGPGESGGRAVHDGHEMTLGPGCGDNAGASLGLGLQIGQTSLSLGTSGVVAAVSATPTHDGSGSISGFADAGGHYLPLACTLNGSRVLDAARAVLGVDHQQFDALALAAAPGAGGLVHVPYLEGERTPNLPAATGSLLGMTLGNLTRQNYARAAVEGVLLLMAAALAQLRDLGVVVDSVALIGGGAKSEAIRRLAPGILGVPVRVPPIAEYVALGAAKQAAWALTGADAPPDWPVGEPVVLQGDDQPALRARYLELRHLFADHPDKG